MDVPVVIPQIGQSIAEATIIRWLKKPGDRIEKGESLVEIGTDKINTELPAPESGVLEKVLVAEGETVPIATQIAILQGESADVPPVSSGQTERESAPEPDVLNAPAAQGDRIRSSPLVRKLAQEHHIDLATLRGSGAGGRITREDIQRAISSKRPVIAETGDVERVPMTRMRKLIAEHMSLSRRTAADVTTVFEMDMTEVVRRRDQAKSSFQSQHQLKLTYLPFIVAAVVKGLRAFPVLNASIEKDEIVLKKRIHVGIAVALEHGLIVPVIRNADEKNILGLARASQDLSDRGRSNRLLPEDLEGGTFTITNPGVFGALMGTPIIHQPQVAILGVGAVVKRAVVINDAIAIRPMAYFSLSYDHRALDGATADQFLTHVKQILETDTSPALP